MMVRLRVVVSGRFLLRGTVLLPLLRERQRLPRRHPGELPLMLTPLRPRRHRHERLRWLLAHRYASDMNGSPLKPPSRISAAWFGTANPKPGNVTMSPPTPICGRADGPCWVSHRFCRMILAAVLNAAGA